MPTENLSVGIALLLTGALIILLCWPLLKDKIKPNALYGMRVPKSFESEENWYKINRFGAKQMMLWAGAMMAFGVLSFFLPLKENQGLTAIVAVAPALFMLVPAIQIYRYSKTL